MKVLALGFGLFLIGNGLVAYKGAVGNFVAEKLRVETLTELQPARSSAVPLIIDTDDDSDIDDTFAISMANHLMDAGEVNVLAVVTDTASIKSPAAAQATNIFYGHPGISVGACDFGCVTTKHEVADAVASRFNNMFESGAAIPAGSTAVYRKALAAQKDRSVAIVVIGTMRSFYNLYKSPADDLSPLDGKQLIETKVRSISVMGGDYSVRYPAHEHNFYTDPVAAQVVNEIVSTPIVWIGYSVGKGITLRVRGHGASPSSVAARAFGSSARPAWDVLATLYAIRGLNHGNENYFVLSKAGTNTVDADGNNTFTIETGGRQHYLLLKEKADDLEVKLNSQINRQPENRDPFVNSSSNQEKTQSTGRCPHLLPRETISRQDCAANPSG